MTTTSEPLRTMFGNRRRLACSRCKDFNTTNQTAYTAHLRECNGGSTPTPSLQLATPSADNAAPALNIPTSNAAMLSLGNWNFDQLAFQQLFLKQLQQQQQQQQQVTPNPQSLLDAMAAISSLVGKPAQQQKQPQQQTPVNFPSTSQQNSKASNRAQAQPPVQASPLPQQPLPMFSEETGSGERYGFREVFKHMYTSTVNGQMAYCCRLCPYQHAVRSRVTKHIRLQHFSKQQLSMFTCELCSFTTQHATELEHHRRRHAVNTKVYKCSECEYSTPMQNNFKRHLRRHTSSDSFVCSSCSFSSPHEATVKRHAFLYHRGCKNQPPADGAPEVMADFDDDNMPIEPALAGVGDNSNSLSNHQLDSAPKKTLSIDEKSNVSSPLSLTDANNDSNVFTCDICSMNFSSLGLFSQHIAQHENAEEMPMALSSALDFRCGAAEPTLEPSGILNLSTKPTQQLSTPNSNQFSTQRVNPRKATGVKRHLIPSEDSPSSDCQVKHQKLDQSPAVNDQESFDRRYGCPVCAFEADDKPTVRKHVTDVHPNQNVTRKNAHASQVARQATAAMLPIRCLNVTRTAPLSIQTQEHSAQSIKLLPVAPELSVLPQIVAFRCSGCPFISRRRNLVERHQRSVPHQTVGDVLSIVEVTGDADQHIEESSTAGLPTPPASHGTPSTSHSSSTHSSPPLPQRHQQQISIFKCSLCGLRSLWKKSIKSHLKTQHPGATDGRIVQASINQQNEFQPSPSLSSPSKRPSTASRSKSHCRRYQCPTCSYRANFYHDVKKHARNLHKISDAEVVVLDEAEAERTLADYLARNASYRRGEPKAARSQGSRSLISVKSRSTSDKLKYCHRSRLLFNCRKCTFHTTRKSYFLSHCASHFSKNVHRINPAAEKCSLCGFHGNQLEQHELLWHGKVKTSTKGSSYKCTICDYCSSEETSMRAHVSAEHVPPALLALGAVKIDALFISA